MLLLCTCDILMDFTFSSRCTAEAGLGAFLFGADKPRGHCSQEGSPFRLNEASEMPLLCPSDGVDNDGGG